MDVSKLEKQADILFNNISGWNTNALKRIGRRVKSMKSLSYADLQAINNATIANQDVNAIMEELAKLTQQNVQDVYRIYGEMISEQHLDNRKLYDYRNKPFIPFSENKELQALVKAYARTTAETFVGLTMTKAKNIGFVDANNNFVPINKQFKTVLDKATVSIATGTGDFGSEMRDVLKELGGSGLRVDYGGGVTRRLDTMVRQNLLWGAKQASVEYNNMISEELGCDGIEIDWHSNPRPSHEFMQGKQYILGKAKTINGIYFESADKALEALQDYGCLHFSTPIICGVSEPAYSPDELKRLNAENKKPIEIDGVTKTGYEWKQTMRRLETEARKTKDQKEILKSNGDNIGANQLDYKLKAIKSKYNLIAKETGIKAQPEKMAVIKSAKTVDKYSKSGIIKTGGKITQNNFLKVAEYEQQATRYYGERLLDDTDIVAISNHTNFSVEDITKIKKHMMSDVIKFKDGTAKPFDADIDQALAWKRLINGDNIKETDVLLLRHELEELTVMHEQNIVFEDAHLNANKLYNWEKAIEEFVDFDELY